MELLPAILLTIHLTLGSSRAPLIVLDQYEGSGIRLTCTSEMLSPELQLLWVDGKGQELLAVPATASPDNASIASSVLLQPGSGNSASCRIVSKLTKTSAGSTSLVIADIFFPSVSPWMVAFIVTVVLGIVGIAAIYFKLKKKERKTSEEVLKQEQDAYGKMMIFGRTSNNFFSCMRLKLGFVYRPNGNRTLT
uniref:Uncharacterized protein n=1 Tax=Sphaerodactylus townsendi TaxID=933632 RepID=A0ACB8EUW3_9SAUR